MQAFWHAANLHAKQLFEFPFGKFAGLSMDCVRLSNHAKMTEFPILISILPVPHHTIETIDTMASHIASISSSARATRQHGALESSQDEAQAETESTLSQADAIAELSTASDLPKMSILSLSDDESLASKTSTRPSRSRKERLSVACAQVVKPDLLSSKLGRLDSIDDIDMNFDHEELQHNKVLDRIEQKWLAISENLDSTMKHLEECSQQVTESSSNCLQALLDSVGSTCDNVDGELKAFYHLMTKCDELTTKLSIATSFRDEIKTMRKSVETLEQLYKNKPQSAPTALLPNRV